MNESFQVAWLGACAEILLVSVNNCLCLFKRVYVQSPPFKGLGMRRSTGKRKGNSLTLQIRGTSLPLQCTWHMSIRYCGSICSSSSSISMFPLANNWHDLCLPSMPQNQISMVPFEFSCRNRRTSKIITQVRKHRSVTRIAARAVLKQRFSVSCLFGAWRKQTVCLASGGAISFFCGFSTLQSSTCWQEDANTGRIHATAIKHASACQPQHPGTCQVKSAMVKNAAIRFLTAK